MAFCKNWISFLVIRTKIDLLPSKQDKTQQNFERKNFDGALCGCILIVEKSKRPQL